MQVNRPTVTVTPIANATGDLTHCEIKIGESIIKALFTEPYTELIARAHDATGVFLTVSEVMAVTSASRHQMEREAERLKASLLALPAGTVAIVDGGMFFWLDDEQELVWEQWITLGEGVLTPAYISCIGDIDPEEIGEVAESVRKWLREPRTEQADLQWLH